MDYVCFGFWKSSILQIFQANAMILERPSKVNESSAAGRCKLEFKAVRAFARRRRARE